jgi:diguanylate cyclase (GGDEF)-like protein
MLRQCLLFSLFFSAFSFAGDKVLLLNSYHSQYQWSHENNLGIRQTLSKHIADDDLYIEFMDSRRIIDDEKHILSLVELYRHKYRLVKLDLIISTDDFALDFLLKYRDELFPNVPVVYNGVNFDPSDKLKDHQGYWGILEGQAIEQNLQLITKLHSDTIEEIIVLSDTSSLGRFFSQQVEKIQAKWKNKQVKITLNNDFSFESLLYQVNNSNANKAYFIAAVHKDNQDRYFSYRHDIPILTRYSKVPIYGMWGTPLLGLGVVGGFMNDPKLHGSNTAQIAIDILNQGQDQISHQQTQAQFLPKFDDRQLKKFAIDRNQLPANSEIIYIEQSLAEQYKELIYSIVFIFIALLIIILILSVQIRRRKMAEQELALLNNELEDKIVQRTMALESSNRALLKLNNRMESLANTDDLTLIPNRRHGHRILDRLNYVEGGDYSIALIDIDHFKRVNDIHGHDMGDRVLQQVSQSISQLIRPTDTVCRWGGEEFLLIMPTTNLDNAKLTCERIRKAISSTPMPPLETLTISIGISNKAQAQTISQLLRHADKALYKAKDQGRDRTICWQD